MMSNEQISPSESEASPQGEKKRNTIESPVQLPRKAEAAVEDLKSAGISVAEAISKDCGIEVDAATSAELKAIVVEADMAKQELLNVLQNEKADPIRAKVEKLNALTTEIQELLEKMKRGEITQDQAEAYFSEERQADFDGAFSDVLSQLDREEADALEVYATVIN